jgi:hypothetical protein
MKKRPSCSLSMVISELIRELSTCLKDVELRVSALQKTKASRMDDEEHIMTALNLRSQSG